MVSPGSQPFEQPAGEDAGSIRLIWRKNVSAGAAESTFKVQRLQSRSPISECLPVWLSGLAIRSGHWQRTVDRAKLQPSDPLSVRLWLSQAAHVVGAAVGADEGRLVREDRFGHTWIVSFATWHWRSRPRRIGGEWSWPAPRGEPAVAVRGSGRSKA